MNVNTLARQIAIPTVHIQTYFSIIFWRDEDPGFDRKVVTSCAMIGLSVWSFVDAVSSLAMAILCLPLLLVDVPFSNAFIDRAKLLGMNSGMKLTCFHYFNFSRKYFFCDSGSSGK